MVSVRQVCLAVCLWVCCVYPNARAVEVLYGYEDESRNYVRNWDFEEDISSANWKLSGCSAVRVPGGNTGDYSLEVINRSTKRSSPYQDLSVSSEGLKPNTNYYFSAFIRVQSRPADPDPYVSVSGYVKTYNADGSSVMNNAGTLKYVMPGGDWMQFGADVRFTEDATKLRLMVEVNPAGALYQIDSWSFIELEHPSDWKEKLDAKIDEFRKAPISITGALPAGVDPSKAEVKVELTRHEFGFGTAIKADSFNSDAETQTKYRDFILKHFNWIVFENDMKWKPMEKAKGHINFGRVDRALDILEQHNKTIRGHALLWDMESTNPLWVQDDVGQLLLEESERRIEYILERYAGRVYEWDVLNEYLHAHFFEYGTQHWEFLADVFRLAHQYDPTPVLCINDFEIARGNGVLASAQANLAKSLVAAGVPCGCIGVQSHMRESPVYPEALVKRMDILSSAGLPITVTEFSAHSQDVAVRAETLDTSYRVYFANPNVQAVVLWGFADQFGSFADDMYLTEGPDFTPNAAGQVLLNLLDNEWHTSEPVDVSGAGGVSSEFRGFRGNYKLTVTEAGAIVHEQDFYVGAGGATVNLAV